MADASAELQKLIHDTLGQDAGVIALVDAIYDKVPANPFGGPNKAFIRFGPTFMEEDDAECISGDIHHIQLDCFSRKVGTLPCKRITDAVKAALHEQELTLAANALVMIRVPFRQVFPDPDELTMHGVVRVEARIENWP